MTLPPVPIAARAWRPRAAGAARRLLVVVLAPLLGACSALPYYSQAICGEWSLLRAARPVEDWLADPATPAPLRQRLDLALQIRRFAAQELGLPDNRSYTRYADLHRTSAVWNVFATPALSLELKTWCYPVFGCAAYRGYFAQADARGLSQQLTDEGLDATVAPVPAFSTLGWFSDPLLSTFINWPEPELARLIFHELAHQVVYVRDDTRFNESFATAVERAGLQRWVRHRADPALDEQFRQYQSHHEGVLALVAATRGELEQLYASAQPDAQRLARKQEIFAGQQQRYTRLRDEQWQGYHGYDAFFLAPWNNARIAAMAAYQDDVPAFEALLAREHGELPRLYAQVKALAALAPQQRAAALQALAPDAEHRL